MKLPIRLLSIIQNQLDFKNSNNKPTSISKDLEKLKVTDEKEDEQKMSQQQHHLQEKDEKLNKKQDEEIKSEIEVKDNQTSNLKKITFLSYLDNIEDFEEALHLLNMKGEKHGIQFKRGNTQYYSDKIPKYKSIICSHNSRKTKKPNLLNSKISSLEKNKEETKEYCSCFYRFKLNKQGKITGIANFDEEHQNHEFIIKKNEITKEMIKEIECFNKTSKVNDIKSFLENKFKVELSYRTLFTEFRRIFPLLGPQDAVQLINWCESNGYDVAKDINLSDKSLTKLLIVSELMKVNYKAYGDVLIVDSTYRVNKYKLPYVIFSGFTFSGKNCLFAIGIVNQETQESFKWLLSKFLEFHGVSLNIVVSDHDLALEAALNTQYQDVKHILCQWHIDQSFSKNFSYLTSMNYGALKEKIKSLLWIEDRETFEATYAEIMKDFKDQKVSKKY